MNTIAYLVYGTRRTYQLELTLSVLSAIRYLGFERPDYRIAVITDSAGVRPDLPVEHVVFDAAEFSRWTRGGTYKHAAKVHALTKAVDCFGDKVALVDTDTCFLGHPDRLFERIGPGRSVMQADEGRLGQHPDWKDVLAGVSSSAGGYEVRAASRMLNSGVVGVCSDIRPRLGDIAALIDELHAIAPVFSIEQFAFTAVLARATELVTCEDLVHHYWGFERGFVHARVDKLFPAFSEQAFSANLAALPPLGYPKKRRLDQLLARAIAYWRRQGPAYRFAYLSYRCALSAEATDRAIANVWADIALTSLRDAHVSPQVARRDFVAMRDGSAGGWLLPEARRDWASYFVVGDGAEASGKEAGT